MKTVISFVFLFALAVSFNIQAQSLKPGTKKSTRPAAVKTGAQRPAMPKGSDFVQEMEHGKINWTDQYIEAEGSSIMDSSRFKLRNQAKLMAQRGAELDAKRKLAETIAGLTIQSETEVRDFITEYDQVRTQLNAVIDGAYIKGKPQFTDQMASVTVELPAARVWKVIADEIKISQR